jgi:hypothetical protein
MNTNAMIDAAVAIIKQKVEAFCNKEDVSHLTGDLAESMTKTLKEAMAQCGIAMYKLFIESFEEQRDILLINGIQYRFKSEIPKEFMTFFGKMEVFRRAYQDKSDGSAYYPLDANWEMVDEYATPDVREAMMFTSAHVTAEESAAIFGKSTLFQPHATTIKHIVESTGRKIAAHQEEIDSEIRARETAPKGVCVLAASLDGVTVLLNEPGAKTGRPAERPGTETSEESPTSYRNAMVGSISFYGAASEPGRAPQRLDCHYAARMPEARFATFKTKFEAELEAAEALCGPTIIKMMIIDGARPLWNYVESTSRYQDYIWVVDFWHSTEHLAKIAELLFGKSTDAAKDWYEEYRTILRDDLDGVHKALRSMDYHARAKNLSKSARKEFDRERNYFLHNQKKMNYAELRARGLPIGSGPVEAACKTLVKTRLGRSGMRWSRVGGQRILDLRTYVKSNRWDEAWKIIKKIPKAA